jgi:hypothetical protein
LINVNAKNIKISFTNPSKKDYEIITEEDSKYIIFFSINVDSMIRE